MGLCLRYPSITLNTVRFTPLRRTVCVEGGKLMKTVTEHIRQIYMGFIQLPTTDHRLTMHTENWTC